MFNNTQWVGPKEKHNSYDQHTIPYGPYNGVLHRAYDMAHWDDLEETGTADHYGQISIGNYNLGFPLTYSQGILSGNERLPGPHDRISRGNRRRNPFEGDEESPPIPHSYAPYDHPFLDAEDQIGNYNLGFPMTYSPGILSGNERPPLGSPYFSQNHVGS